MGEPKIEKPEKKEYVSMRVPKEVAEICKDYAKLEGMQNPSIRFTISDAFEKIYEPKIDISLIKTASDELVKIRKDSISASKVVLKGIGF